MSKTNDIRSHFSIFAERYRPPEEFAVFLPGGEALVFRGMRSATELDEIRTKIHKTVTAVRKAPSAEYRQFLKESDAIWTKAFRMQETMVGFHPSSKLSEDRKTRVPDGERLAAFTPLEMLEFAAQAAPTFENVDFDWEVAQYRAITSAESGEVADLKNA